MLIGTPSESHAAFERDKNALQKLSEINAYEDENYFLCRRFVRVLFGVVDRGFNCIGRWRKPL